MIKRLLEAPSIDWAGKFEKRAALSAHPALKAFYQSGLPDGDTPLKNIRFLAMDFETTGLDYKDDSIISIGVVPFDLNRIYLREAQEWKVRPRKQLSEDSVVIHGITHSDLIDAPDFEDVIPEVLKSMQDVVTVVHYHHIERRFLDHEFRSRYGDRVEFPLVDTMAIESNIQQRLNGGLINRLKGKTTESLRLAKSRERYGLPTYSPHHALTDAIATAELLQAQIHYNQWQESRIKEIWI
ncbi:3'-5' exonuclease [Vibrio agarivorans]|uniref:3'-5' exonuclease n=1 Tax=Vibrio agarivorans TaxID=153622 RepID=UPI00222E29EB|nr:3'-5' exonuclease [Vibrio agarivorans]MDN3663084.1 3'-5' exonuclease [Vibrio agarivorans]